MILFACLLDNLLYALPSVRYPMPIDHRLMCTPFIVACALTCCSWIVLFNRLHTIVILLLISKPRWGVLSTKGVLPKLSTEL